MVDPPRVSRSPDRWPDRPVSVPGQSTPWCSANRLSSIDTIASFMVLAIWSVGTSNRRWEYSQAIRFPAASTIVETCGTSPSRICADSSATTSNARLNNSPTPPAIGNINAAATSPANRQHPASLVTAAEVGVRSDIRELSAAWPRDCGECPQRIAFDVGVFGGGQLAGPTTNQAYGSAWPGYRERRRPESQPALGPMD